MKKVFILLLIALILPTTLAININVEKTSSDEVMILDLESPTTFGLSIRNNGVSDDFSFYTFFGLLVNPTGTIQINSGETKEVEVQILPSYNLNTGFSTFNLFIRGQDGTEISKELLVRIVDLKDAFEIGSGEIDPETSSLEVYIHNKINFNFENVDVKFSSVFFDLEESFNLEANQRKTFNVQLDKEDFKKLQAGFYTLRADITVDEKETQIEGIIKFIEKDIVTTSKKEYGLIINTRIIEKANEGNVLASSETVIKKNVISRLFTSFSPEPDFVDREGLLVYYTWDRQIAPGETLKIVIRTNWLLPFLIIILVIIVVILAKRYSGTNLRLRKKVTFVKAKGGEFALKVSLFVHARKYVEKVNIIDRLPSLVKIYERFGGDHPSRVDEKNRRIEWNFEKLEAGEIRSLSYIIYSKVGVLGKFALPAATAIYERDGEIKESNSNRAFFIAEQRTKSEE